MYSSYTLLAPYGHIAIGTAVSNHLNCACLYLNYNSMQTIKNYKKKFL